MAPEISSCVYSRALLLHLSHSPLVCRPEGLKPLPEWYGDYEAPHTPHHKTQELPRERAPRGERNGREEARRERREREREAHTNGDAAHDHAQPFGAMGDFRLPNRSAKRGGTAHLGGPSNMSEKDDGVGHHIGHETKQASGATFGGDTYRPARDRRDERDRDRREDKEKDVATLPGGRKQGRAEDGGWRTGRVLSDRVPEHGGGGSSRRHGAAAEEGRREHRRDAEPAWMDDDERRPLTSQPDKEQTKAEKAPAWSMPKAAPPNGDLGGHIDKLQAFKAQMKALEERERGGNSDATVVSDPRRPAAAAVAAPASVEESTVARAPLSLASLGLDAASRQANGEKPTAVAANGDVDGLRGDPAIASSSNGDAFTGDHDGAARPRGSRFAKYFGDRLPTSSATTMPAQPGLASIPSPMPATQAAPLLAPEISQKSSMASHADQESFRRLMDMLQMSAAPVQSAAPKHSGTSLSALHAQPVNSMPPPPPATLPFHSTGPPPGVPAPGPGPRTFNLPPGSMAGIPTSMPGHAPYPLQMQPSLPPLNQSFVRGPPPPPGSVGGNSNSSIAPNRFVDRNPMSPPPLPGGAAGPSQPPPSMPFPPGMPPPPHFGAPPYGYQGPMPPGPPGFGYRPPHSGPPTSGPPPPPTHMTADNLLGMFTAHGR